LGAVMSGSGASVFGIFNDRLLAEKVFDSIRKENTRWKIFLTEPLK
jgi:4-diphosphocytidyl-2C-methyl-D-erythritol kinase